MASIEYVVNAVDDASGTFERIARSADQLNDDLDKLSKKVARPEVDLEDADATLKLDTIADKIDKLKAKVADPDIDPRGLRSAQIAIDRLDVSLDRLSKKRATPEIDLKEKGGGFLSRLFGGGGIGSVFGGGGAAGDAGGGGGGLGGLLGGIPWGSVLGWGGLATIAGLVTPSLVPAAIGGGTGILGLILGDPKGLKGLGTSLSATVKKALAPLKDSFTDIFEGLDKFVKDDGPKLATVFRDSLPFLKSFTGFLETTATILLPVISKMLNEMVSSGALKLVGQGFTAIVQGIAGFLKALGPQGMQASAKLFVDFARTVGAALTVLGKFLNWLAQAVQNTSAGIHQDWDALRHHTATVFDGIRHDILHYWDLIWNGIQGKNNTGIGWVIGKWNAFRRNLGQIMILARSDIVHDWDTIWSESIGAIIHGTGVAVSWFHGLPSRILGALMGLGSELYAFGAQALQKLWNGMESVAGGLLGWLQHLLSQVSSLTGGLHIHLGAMATATGNRVTHMANGGVIGEPVFGIGLRSGNPYAFGENGPETVIPGRRGTGTTLIINVAVPATVNPRAAGQQIAELILPYTRAGGRLYPQGMTPK